MSQGTYDTLRQSLDFTMRAAKVVQDSEHMLLTRQERAV